MKERETEGAATRDEGKGKGAKNKKGKRRVTHIYIRRGKTVAKIGEEKRKKVATADKEQGTRRARGGDGKEQGRGEGKEILDPMNPK